MTETTRMLLRVLGAWAAIVATSLGGSAGAVEHLRGDHIAVSWLAPDRMASDADTLGIYFEPDAGWHVYWSNPGDSGTAPKFQFTTRGATLGPITWPAPARLPVVHLTNLGYHGAVALPFRVTPSPGVERVELSAKLEWLVCREDECVPGFATLTLDRPVAAEGARWPGDAHERLDVFSSRVPRAMREAPWRIDAATLDANQLRVKLVRHDAAAPAPDAFPKDGAFISPKPPGVEQTSNGFELVFATMPGSPAPSSTSFVFVAGERAFEADDVAITPNAPPASGSSPRQEASGLVWILLSAFLGGLLLNLMPCVLPVLSIKFLSLARSESGSRMREALLYTAGVVTTFAALGAAVIALQSAGEAVGWGFQLQSPVVVLALVILFWLMALNFLGVFEVGFLTMAWAGRAKSSSAFATGILSVFVAAPCTGPFMGTALGATATLPPLSSMSIFVALGLGLASPFVGLAASPRLLAKLPKPGAWMESLKQFFAFPLFATVLWLVFVLGVQTGTQGWLMAGSVLLVVAFSLWLGRFRRLPISLVAALLSLVTVVAAARELVLLADAPKTSNTASAFVPFDKGRIEAARQAGQPVFVDFTAAWCITCQVNKQVVLETEAAQELFRAHGVLLVAADWTTRDATITEALAGFGRNSVPLYVFYPAGGAAPQVLPQVLSLSTLEDLF